MEGFWENGLCYASTGNILNSKGMYHFPPKRVHKFEWHEFYFSSLERTEVAVVGRLSYKGGENGSQQGGGHDRTRKSTLCLHSRMRIPCAPNLKSSSFQELVAEMISPWVDRVWYVHAHRKLNFQSNGGWQLWEVGDNLVQGSLTMLLHSFEVGELVGGNEAHDCRPPFSTHAQPTYSLSLLLFMLRWSFSPLVHQDVL